MSDATESDADGIVPPARRRGAVSFLGVVSLGNVLILLGMLGTGMLGIYTVGGQVQHLNDSVDHLGDQIRHETELRVQAQGALQQQYANDKTSMQQQFSTLQRQESADIAAVNNSITSLHADVRTLLQFNPRDGRAH